MSVWRTTMSRIGVFDSGLGGFTIAQAIHGRYPNQDIVFLADQKNVPYGNKETADLEDIIYENMRWFYDLGIRDIILACNTTSVLLLTKVQEDFRDLNLIRIIELTVSQLSKTRPQEILVLATKVTIASHRYKQEIEKILPTCIVHEVALPNLAKLIEDLADDSELHKDFSEYLAKYHRSNIDFMLGCTHYPLADKQLKSYLGGVSYSSIKPILEQASLFSEGSGLFTCYTTGDKDIFQRQIKQLYGIDQAINKVDM